MGVAIVPATWDVDEAVREVHWCRQNGLFEHWDERSEDWHVTSKLGDYKSHLSMKPSDYYRRNVRTGSFLATREMERREQIGVETMMWGSDYPHPEGTWPHTREAMIETFSGLPEAEIAAMLGGNAAECYGFDTEKLAPIVARIGPEKAVLAG